jgi:molecular chaperone GrpE (heat shock protein)
VLRRSLPHLLRLLPLLDGNVGSAVSNLISPPPPPLPPPPPVNLGPIKDGLAALQAESGDLHAQILEQHASLERIEERLERIAEATSRNAAAQQDLLKELNAIDGRLNQLKAAGDRSKKVAIAALVLLGVTVLLNILLLCLRRV